MNKLQWGIIGCGDVTEVKSGPAFNKVANSSLVAVMRRDAAKAKDYATRHNVPKWYSSAQQLIADPDINAIYVATPPSSHEEYTIAALKAGKPVYVEKPMTIDTASAQRMAEAAARHQTKLTVAHYRRAQPLFQKIKQLVDDRVIGEPRLVQIDLCKRALTAEEMAVPKTSWRVDSKLAGGGLFNDLAPHQLDILYHILGDVDKSSGVAVNQAKLYAVPDVVTGFIQFKSGVVFSGSWCFSSHYGPDTDTCEIRGDKGLIRFSFFDHRPITVITPNGTEEFVFEPLQHVQQPMISRVTEYFLGTGTNPCPPEDGVLNMQLIDRFTK
jgi:predicted dehydrogenase